MWRLQRAFTWEVQDLVPGVPVCWVTFYCVQVSWCIRSFFLGSSRNASNNENGCGLRDASLPKDCWVRWQMLLGKRLRSLQFSWCFVQFQHLRLHLLNYFLKTTFRSHRTLAFHLRSFQIFLSWMSASSAKKLSRSWALLILPLVSIFWRMLFTCTKLI